MSAANLSKNKDPYRRNCSGEWTGKLYWPKYGHYRKADAAIPRFKNITLQPNGSGGWQSPVPIPDTIYDPSANPNTEGCYGPLSPGATPLIIPGYGTPEGDNGYVQLGVVNKAVCYKFGFKSASAAKCWQGAPGFLAWTVPIELLTAIDCQNCVWLPYQSTPQLTRYLSASLTGSIITTAGANCGCTGVPCKENEGTATYDVSVTVDRYSGIATVVNSNIQVNILQNIECVNDPVYCPTNTPIPSCSAGAQFPPEAGCTCIPDDTGPFICTNGNQHVLLMQATYACAPAISLAALIPTCMTNFSGPVNHGDDQEWQPSELIGYSLPGTLTTVVTNNSFTLNFIADPGGLGITSISLTLTLSNPYTSDDVNMDADDMLSYWDLSDDVVYPWRQDSLVTHSPLVTYTENYGNPMSYIGNATGTYNIPAGTPGQLLGAPLPAGYDKFWDCQRKNYQGSVNNSPPTLPITVVSWGAYSPDWCPNATQWTDDWIATGLYAGAYTGIDGGSNNLFPFWVEGELDGNPTQLPIYENYCFKQKWAETILLVKPSHNFARPCGSDNTTVNAITGCTETNPWPTAAACPDPPDSGYQWNDTNQKGDYVTRDLIYNARQLGETARLQSLITNWLTGAGCGTCQCYTPGTTGPGCGTDDTNCPTPPTPAQPFGSSLVSINLQQQCAEYLNCCPAVCCISPNDEVWDNGFTIEMPWLDLDDLYGAFVYQDVQQWMVDPLFTPPTNPDCNGIKWNADNGTCQACQIIDDVNNCYYAVPYEEARTVVPSGAPPMPVYTLLNQGGLGAQWIGTWASPTWIGSSSYQPTIGGDEGTIQLWFNQIANCCNFPDCDNCENCEAEL